jgi:hypothetical protein
MGSELAICALIHGKKQPLQIGHEPLCLEGLELEPRLFHFVEWNPSQAPSEHRRHHHRGDDSHGDNHREQVLAQDAHR